MVTDAVTHILPHDGIAMRLGILLHSGRDVGQAIASLAYFSPWKKLSCVTRIRSMSSSDTFPQGYVPAQSPWTPPM